MLQALVNGYTTSRAEVCIPVWNLKRWMESIGLKQYKNIFAHLKYDELFTLAGHFYYVRNVPLSVAVRLAGAIRHVAEQDMELVRIRYDVFQSVILVPSRALMNLKTFLLVHPRPFLGKIPWLFVQILERLIYVTLWIPLPFERMNCQMMAYELCKIVLDDVSFTCYDLTFISAWTESVAPNFIINYR